MNPASPADTSPPAPLSREAEIDAILKSRLDQICDFITGWTGILAVWAMMGGSELVVLAVVLLGGVATAVRPFVRAGNKRWWIFVSFHAALFFAVLIFWPRGSH